MGELLMFFVLLATLKASVFRASLWNPAVQKLRKRPSTKNTNIPSPLGITSCPPPADTKLPIIPHSVLVFQLHNRVLITESSSHMKSQTSTVTSHIYLEKWLWQTSAGPCLSSMLFWGLCAFRSYESLTLKVFSMLQMADWAIMFYHKPKSFSKIILITDVTN